MDITVGRVVIATAGREKGNFLIVVTIEGDRCFVVNGKNRTLLNPKCKNILHLKKTNTSFTLTGETTDKQIRRFLNEFSNS